MPEDRLKHAVSWSGKRQRKRLNQEARRAVKRGSVIYFIEAGDFIKIGLSTADGLNLRMTTLQTGCPYPMKLLKVISTSHPASSERKIHELFRRFHFRGEWFKIPHDDPAYALVCKQPA